jgi:primosomal protein N' (replication factor Y)
MAQPRASSAAPTAAAPKAAAPTAAAPKAAGDVSRVAVLLPLPLAHAYDYRLAPGLTLAPGDFVAVPLGARRAVGVVWDRGDGPPAPVERLRDVLRRLPAPPLPEVSRRFIEWVADYTLAPPGVVLRMAMSIPDALEAPRPVLAWRLAAACAIKLTPARRRVLAVLADGPPRELGELRREAGAGASVVKGLAALGLIEAVELPPPPVFLAPDGDRPGPALSPAQTSAAAALIEGVAKGGYSATLLDGVTGAGKTEVYFEAVAAALRSGRQALVLLPEIALGASWLGRFQRRFGVLPAAWHSDLTQAERRLAWRAVAGGEARVVVGARSALFLPFPNLGLIVVDEEHDGAYKQEEGVIYQARDMAVVRAHLGKLPVVLVSATPSLETVRNVAQGRYAVLHLPDRHAGASLPRIEAIDLRRQRPARQRWLSPPLRQALIETVAAGEQALLFLNRRGYAPLTLCRACGHRLQCPSCTAWLVEHRFRKRLQCHHCGYEIALPSHCPACAAPAEFAACGPGVERLAEEARALLPQARIELMTSDTVTGPRAAAALLGRVEAGAVDILIGTQVVAKGHHFPGLTLVGVVDADLGLIGGDLRAGERTYQLLHQVGGRAGRADKPGRVLLQTYEPDHPVMRALVAGERDGFLERESAARKTAGLPPFGRLAALILSGPNEAAVDAAARNLARAAPRGEGIRVLGPAPAPLAILRGRHRRRFLLKCRRDIRPQPLLRAWLAAVKLPASVRLQVDVDPYSFL